MLGTLVAMLASFPVLVMSVVFLEGVRSFTKDPYHMGLKPGVLTNLLAFSYAAIILCLPVLVLITVWSFLPGPF